MNKLLVTLFVIPLALTLATACPPPTSHAVITLGCAYDYSLTDKTNGVQNLGVVGRVGYQEPYRFLTISAVGNYIVQQKAYNVGGELSINPLGVFHGYETPINFEVIAGVGYGNKSNLYTNVGVELTMNMEHMITPYARCMFTMGNLLNSPNMPEYGVTACVGVRVSLGKGW